MALERSRQESEAAIGAVMAEFEAAASLCAAPKGEVATPEQSWGRALRKREEGDQWQRGAG